MSSMRSAAKGLVETRRERFESRHTLDESRRRLEAAAAKLAPLKSVRFTPSWTQDQGRAVLDAEFAPTAGTGRLLNALSIGMALLVAASAWAMIASDAGAASFLLPLITVLAILGLPFLALGLASQRDADESRLRKAIRVALLDEEERLPPAKKWDDEE